MLDSAGYATFTVTKAISIVAPPGVVAGISVFSGDGIDINAGASDTVILRGLTVNNQGSAGSGIVFNTGGTLHVESCVVNGFSLSATATGLSFNGSGTLEVKDSILRDCRVGILVFSSAALATFDQVRLEGSVNSGLTVNGGKATIRNSIATAGSNDGLVALAFNASPAELSIENCVVSNNGNNGILADSVGTAIAMVRVSNSTITDNGTGIFNSGFPANVLSRGNNTVEGNTTNTSGTIGSYTAK